MLNFFRLIEKKKNFPSIILGIFSLVSLGGIFSFFWVVSFNKEIRFVAPVNQYRRAELTPSDLISRKWIMFAIELQKQQNYGPSFSSRLYAYTASVFADILKETGEVSIANAATALMLQELIPSEEKEISSFLYSLSKEPSAVVGSAKRILDTYVERSRTDGSSLVWKEDMVPRSPEAWYVRTLEEYPQEIINAVKASRGFSPTFTDDGAMSGQWRPWVVLEDPDGVPLPPKRGSLADSVDVEKIFYATNHRTFEERALVSFWHGAGGFFKGQQRDNISPAGVWLNILFIEQGKDLEEGEFAQAQKILAQTLADAFIYTWKVKYQYYIQRPSMRFHELNTVIADPPFPSYVSGHSTISHAAAAVLTPLFPEKKELWYTFARDARYSRLLGGIHYDSDNAAGAYYGERIGMKAAQAFNLEVGRSQVIRSPSTSTIENLVAWIGLRTSRFLSEWEESFDEKKSVK